MKFYFSRFLGGWFGCFVLLGATFLMFELGDTGFLPPTEEEIRNQIIYEKVIIGSLTVLPLFAGFMCGIDENVTWRACISKETE